MNNLLGVFDKSYFKKNELNFEQGKNASYMLFSQTIAFLKKPDCLLNFRNK
jgi:hypothetical protein